MLAGTAAFGDRTGIEQADWVVRAGLAPDQPTSAYSSSLA